MIPIIVALVALVALAAWLFKLTHDMKEANFDSNMLWNLHNDLAESLHKKDEKIALLTERMKKLEENCKLDLAADHMKRMEDDMK